MFCSPYETRVARKSHRCSWCGQPIDIGTTYYAWRNFDDGWVSNKMHGECKDALGDEAREDGDYFYAYEPYQNDRPEIPTPAQASEKEPTP